LTDAAAHNDAEFRKLRWRCRRGMRELDVLLERYLEGRFRQAPAEERAAFSELLDFQDPEVWRFCIGEDRPASPALAAVIERLTAVDTR
jgi:antitoxin CptB